MHLKPSSYKEGRTKNSYMGDDNNVKIYKPNIEN